MSKWTVTPFKSLDEAHEMASKMGLNPSAITDHQNSAMRTFQVREAREVFVMAQAITGGPVKEKQLGTTGETAPVVDPLAPRSEPVSTVKVGPWCLTDKKSLEEVKTFLRSQFVNPDNVEILPLLLFRFDGDEYEYLQDARGTWVRLLTKRK